MYRIDSQFFFSFLAVTAALNIFLYRRMSRNVPASWRRRKTVRERVQRVFHFCRSLLSVVAWRCHSPFTNQYIHSYHTYDRHRDFVDYRRHWYWYFNCNVNQIGSSTKTLSNVCVCVCVMWIERRQQCSCIRISSVASSSDNNYIHRHCAHPCGCGIYSLIAILNSVVSCHEADNSIYIWCIRFAVTMRFCQFLAVPRNDTDRKRNRFVGRKLNSFFATSENCVIGFLILMLSSKMWFVRRHFVCCARVITN